MLCSSIYCEPSLSNKLKTPNYETWCSTSISFYNYNAALHIVIIKAIVVYVWFIIRVTHLGIGQHWSAVSIDSPKRSGLLLETFVWMYLRWMFCLTKKNCHACLFHPLDLVAAHELIISSY